MNYTEYEHSSALSWSPALRLSGSQPQKDTRQAAQLDGSFPLPLGLNRGGGWLTSSFPFWNLILAPSPHKAFHYYHPTFIQASPWSFRRTPCFAHLSLQLTRGGSFLPFRGFQNPSGENLQNTREQGHMCILAPVCPQKRVELLCWELLVPGEKETHLAGIGPLCLLP